MKCRNANGEPVPCGGRRVMVRREGKPDTFRGDEQVVFVQRTGGPGTELKKLLSRIGIHADGSCACNSMAQRMDMHGGDWCIREIDAIADHLCREAKNRGGFLPRFAARKLVRVAVKRAEKRQKENPID